MPEAKKAAMRETVAGMPGMQGTNPDYVAFLEGTYGRWIDNLFRLSEGLSQFALHRIHQDFAAWAKLATCRDPKELMGCQRVVAEKATARFADDFTKVLQMITTIAGESYRPLPGSESRAS